MALYLPRKLIIFEFQRCHWRLWNDFSGVIDTAEISNRLYKSFFFLLGNPAKIFQW
jgi:hypothetical protein